jgi:hypothetical protein
MSILARKTGRIPKRPDMSHNPIRPWRDIQRRKSRQIHVGPVPIGGDAPIAVQTMTNTLTTRDAKAATIVQIQALRRCGRRHRPRLGPRSEKASKPP